ncbi:MAG: hypothetical protein HC862_32210 [Scytonema sp. RU_4_4]|nr:hypothetical protein [Scytonema sp. RU_4_4]
MTHSPTVLLEQLRLCETYNLRPVLIFDQFEEFFFVDTEPEQKRQFFEFLGECLNILPVKVIVSLRVDYLHYLLQCNRLPSMAIINNDILGKNVLYELGNFSPTDAKSIIQQLTERSHFHLEPALIEELVQDLARELGEVRPIELQVVGAQLQTENITTLAKYRECCTKEELVKRYLDEVVQDCGEENQQTAEFVLYLLTDEKGTRPLKTRAELDRDLQGLVADVSKEASKLDLILEIFVESGLVVLLKENPANRYQLVHDYLAEFIRQQQEPKLTQVMAELEREKEQRKLSERKLNRFLRVALAGSVAAVFGFAILAQQAEKQRKQAEISEIKALINSSETFSNSEQTLDALIDGLTAAGKLKKIDWAKADTRMRTVATLQQAVYIHPKENKAKENKVIEVNTLEGHSSYVWSVAFSPDGKTIASGSWDNSIKLWDVATGKELKTLKGHSSEVQSVAFSPDGKTIASGSRDKTVILWNLDFNELMSDGCHLLNHYLVAHPETLAELEECQTPSLLVQAASVLVIQGEKLARNDNVKDAVAKFSKAQKWDSRLKFDPKAKAQEFAIKGEAKRLVAEGGTLAKEGKVTEAIAAYTQAQKLDPKVEIDTSSWESLCWYGSLHRHAADVMFACEKAVQLAPNNVSTRARRGLARALTGNTQGAIEDFEAYIAQTDDKKWKSRFQGWVKDLRALKNPFTDAELKKLLQQ